MSVWYWMKFPLAETGLVGIVNMQGFEFGPPEQVAPVTFQPENVQPAVGLAVISTGCPTGCGQPDGQDGETEPCPTYVVVRMGDVWRIVTVSGGAWRVSPWAMPVTLIVYVLLGGAGAALTTMVVTKDGFPVGWAKYADTPPSCGEVCEASVTF